VATCSVEASRLPLKQDVTSDLLQHSTTIDTYLEARTASFADTNTNCH